MFKNYAASSYKEILLQRIRAHSSVWIEWLPAEQLVEGSNPSGPILKTLRKRKIDPAEFNPDSPADNQRKEAYDSVDTSED
jgi:hypothetical protein